MVPEISLNLLSSFHARRLELERRLETNARAQAKLRAADDAEAAAMVEIREIADADATALRAWAADGCHGNPPSPDIAARRGPAERLAAAHAAQAAVERVAGELSAEAARLRTELVSLQAQIEAAALDAARGEWREAVADACKAADGFRVAYARAIALRGLLHAQASSPRLSASQEAIAMHRTADTFTPPIFDLEPSPADRAAAMAAWDARLAELAGGTA
ncbi:hypothetical protein [Beijerinckia mobilis]|uniref:hypothetical protein n=1 Tax=Beijerinckia mobilis TaxID=231434 RepID=UPI0005564AAE|nr:hypothetical protein [Beijerinckia mobilis]